MDKVNFEVLREQIDSLVGSKCEVYDAIGNDDALIIPSERLMDVVALIDQIFDGAHLTTITAQQRAGQHNLIELMYHFYQKFAFTIIVRLPAEAPSIASILSILPGADFYEREVAEMFGVKFTGRTETPPLLLPDDWDQGPPFIRKEVIDE